MNHNALELIDQVKLTLTMNYGHHMMVDMEKINVLWDNRFHISEESKIQNALMAKSMKLKY